MSRDTTGQWTVPVGEGHFTTTKLETNEFIATFVGDIISAADAARRTEEGRGVTNYTSRPLMFSIAFSSVKPACA